MDAVVVGIDGSGHAREALKTAIAEAAWRNAEVVAVHVVHYPRGIGYDPGLIVPPETLISAGQEALDKEIAAVEADYPDGFPVRVTGKVRIGHTGIQMLEVGEDEDIDVVLTVAGSRGLGGFKGLLVGSTTTYLVHHVKTPLLIVPPTPGSTE